jgi:hypothetical protein
MPAEAYAMRASQPALPGICSGGDVEQSVRAAGAPWRLEGMTIPPVRRAGVAGRTTMRRKHFRGPDGTARCGVARRPMHPGPVILQADASLCPSARRRRRRRSLSLLGVGRRRCPSLAVPRREPPAASSIFRIMEADEGARGAKAADDLSNRRDEPLPKSEHFRRT